MKSIIIVFVLTNLVYQQCFGYIERRTFRERSRIHCRLGKQCKHYEEWDYEYRQMMKLSDVPGTQPDGYLVRFPFYVVAERDAHIVFSETENPDWFESPDVYEFAFGGWENKRATLRRKRQDAELIFTYTDEILTKNCPLKLLIEITTAGTIRAYVEHSLKPIIEFKDPNPLQIKYFGFSSLGQSVARFYYDCHGDEVYTKSQLRAQCDAANTTTAEHTKFHRIEHNSIAETDQYAVEMPLHVAASQNAHILLASDDSFNSIRSGYEFVIGESRNRIVSILKIGNQSTSALGDYRVADIFLPNEILHLFVRISRWGKIEIFSKHDHTQYKLLATADDNSFNAALPLNYISFASYNNTAMESFYDCTMQPADIDTQIAIKYASPGHPSLLEDPAFQTTVDKRNWLTSRCKTYTNSKYEYRDFIKISDLQNSKPSGYILRLAFYAQGTRNAHVLLSRTTTPDLANEAVYEFIIGGWVNSRVLIRRKKSDPNPMQQVFVPPILSAQQPTKFIIEVANSGIVRIFSEHDKVEPIATVFDPFVVPVNYISFCAYDNLVRFYYDCGGQH